MIHIWLLALLPGIGLIACQKARPEQRAVVDGSQPEEAQLVDDDDAEGSGSLPSPLRFELDVLSETANKTSALTRIGIMLYYNGEKLGDDPERFAFDFIITPPETPTLQVKDYDDDPPYDRIIAVSAATNQAVQEAYKDIKILVSIVDKSSTRADTVRTTLAELLQSPSSSGRAASQAIPTVSIHSLP